MSFGDAGLLSLRSILADFGVLNGNLVGVNRNGYKATNLSYGGNGSTVSNGNTMFPDQALIANHTSLDFSQGQVVSTGQPTDLAISGDGFFAVQQFQDVGLTPPSLLTRDGAFRFTNVPALGGDILATNNGQAVLRDSSGTGAGPYVPILKTDFLNNNFRPTVVLPTSGVDSLEFSNQGATVFKLTSGGITPVPGSTINDSSIETSNSDQAASLTALSLNQKRFAAMAASLKEEQSDLDIVLGFFR
jgi:flagellar basal-body rod protein FlgF